MTTLHDRLADLADGAPLGGPAPGLWDAGVRRRRRRAAVGVLVAAVVVAAGLGLALQGVGGTQAPVPADVPFGDLHLPRTVYAPSPWSDGTADAGPPGPLAALSVATRTVPHGLTGSSTSTSPFGVSAVDGTARFLDLVGTDSGELGYGWIALSPDGHKVGYARVRHGTLLGWAVYDTTTGSTVRLTDPGNPVIHGTDVFEIGFSGDSRYLQTNYSPTGSDGSRDDQLVVWDVATGERIEVEPVGFYWLPSMGSGPQGVVWSRGHRTFTFEPSAGRTTSQRVPQDVVQASYGPSGRSSAYVAFGPTTKADWRLYTDGHLAHPGIVPDDILGWQDPEHVVVRSLPDQQVRYVDVRTGTATAVVRLRSENLPMSPLYADDLWANALVDGVRPPHVGDPRPDLLLVGLGAVAVLLATGGALVLWRRRARP